MADSTSAHRRLPGELPLTEERLTRALKLVDGLAHHTRLRPDRVTAAAILRALAAADG